MNRPLPGVAECEFSAVLTVRIWNSLLTLCGHGGPADEARPDIMVPGSAGVVTQVGMSGDRLELLRAGPAVPVPV